MHSDFLLSIRDRASRLGRRIALPDSQDIRTLQAAQLLVQEGICRPCLVGDEEAIYAPAERHGIILDGVPIIDPAVSPHAPLLADALYNKRSDKGLSREEARRSILDPLLFAGLMLDRGLVDGCVGGSESTTSDILRAGIRSVGLADSISVVSSFFLMAFPDKVFAYADCGVVPEPTAEHLADIAIATAENFHKLTDKEPRVAMLSFSTYGSAEHTTVSKVRRATELAQVKRPDLCIDGELQFDAAFVPEVAARKAPGSALAGRANVFIFPDLNSGNIAYKITERLAGARAIGPNVQGLRYPYLDLSRGCSVDDIVTSAALCALMA